VRTRVSPSIRRLRPPAPREVRIDAAVDHVLSILRLQHRWIQKPSRPASWMTIIGSPGRSAPRLAPELRRTDAAARDLARRNRVLGHLLPPPGDREVISRSYVTVPSGDKDRAKIVRIAPAQAGVRLQASSPPEVGGSAPHSQRAAVTSRRPWDLPGRPNCPMAQPGMAHMGRFARSPGRPNGGSRRVSPIAVRLGKGR